MGRQEERSMKREESMGKAPGKEENRQEVYRSLWRMGLKKEERVYVIGHRNPDPDSVGAAMALSFLLQGLGIPAEALTAGEVSPETGFALKRLGLCAPRAALDAKRGAYYLVDHSSYEQGIPGLREGRILGILDHHALGDAVTGQGVKVTCAPVGASCSLVYLACRECGLLIPKEMARAMLMGILSDTRNLSRNMTPLDEEAAGVLLGLSGLSLEEEQELYRGMARASASYEGMTDREIFESRYKVYALGSHRVGIGDVNVLSSEELFPMAERMEEVMREARAPLLAEVLFTMVTDKGEEELKQKGRIPCRMVMAACGEETRELLRRAFPEAGEEKGLLLFPGGLSRKTAVLPALEAVLDGC